MNKTNVKPAEGKLGIMVVGNGAVATTFMTGVLMASKGLAKPVGSMSSARVSTAHTATEIRFVFLFFVIYSTPSRSAILL